jgi:hypothetical protein
MAENWDRTVIRRSRWYGPIWRLPRHGDATTLLAPSGTRFRTGLFFGRRWSILLSLSGGPVLPFRHGHGGQQGVGAMRAFSIVGLLFAAVVLATIPVSPQVTPRGVELSVDQAQAVTYRRARVTARRVDRRVYRHTRRAVRRGVY